MPGPSRPGNVTPPYSTSARKGIQDYLGGAVAVLHANGSDLAEASRLAGEADVVLVVAGSRHDEVGEYISDEQGLRPNGPEQKKPLTIKLPFMKEPFVMSGGDRVPLALKERDLKVIEAAAKANKCCIVALVGGSVFTMEEWKNDVPAVPMAWYFGMEGGHALARVLFGEVNPSAKMPLTTPKDEWQLPLFDKEKREPAFPFGHGLPGPLPAAARARPAPPRHGRAALAGLLLAAPVFVSPAMLSPGRREGAPARPPAAATVAVPSGCAGPPPAPGNADFEARVVELVNERRRAAGQPPLKQVEELSGSSRWFARAMATQDYVAEDHHSYVRSGGDLRLACRWSTRIGWFYARWTALAETIAAGHETPEEVVRGWMDSPGHRAKLLSRRYWEAGAGYWAGGSEGHYWVQDLGRRGGSFPVVIDGEARSTPTRDVRLHVYGSWREMRLRNDDGPFGPWRRFASDLDWRLAEAGGLRTVMVEMRDGRTLATASDEIWLSPEPPT